MRRFSRVLRQLDRRLEVREPERSRILLELAGDLEDLYRAYRDRGYGEEEARRRAVAWLVPDDGSMAGLRRLYMPWFGGLLSPLSDVARSRLESAALTVLTLGAIAGGIGGIETTSLLGPPRPAALALLVLGGLGVGLAAHRALDLFLTPGGDPAGAGTLPGLLSLAAGAAVVGALGGCLELGRAVGEAAGSPGGAVPWEGIGTGAGTAALGLLVSLVLALAWFWLVARVRVIRRARTDLHEAAPWMKEGPRGEPKDPRQEPTRDDVDHDIGRQG